MKKLQVRMFKEDDFKELVDWVIKIKQIIPVYLCLPGVGALVVDDEGKKYGCGFLYLSTDTPVSVLEWVHFNPECTAREKVMALKCILTSLECCAKAEDHPMMFAGSASNGITKIFERAGWTPTIKKMTHLIKILK